MTTEWWSDLYDDVLADVLLERADPRETEATVRLLVDTLRLRPGDRVFDQCSGIGSLAVPLAKWGADVTGVEQAAEYVERARRAADAVGVAPTFLVGDAREVVPNPPCRGAFNWWTSFGYSEDDATNARMLARAFDALEPGGRFVLDYPNVPGLLRGFRPQEITRRATPRGDVLMLRESWISPERGLLHKRWTFLAPGAPPYERPSTLRLYMPDRLISLLESVGFTRVRLLGSIQGEPLSLDSPRCIAVAEKAGRP